jgi:outer membrane PBP1 activator LpoA protein
MRFAVRLKLVTAVTLLSLLSGCSTTEKKAETTKPTNQIQQEVVNAQSLFLKAKKSLGADRIQLLHIARDHALDEQNWALLQAICEDLLAVSASDKVQNELYIALSSSKLKQFNNALSILEELNYKLASPHHYLLNQYIYATVYSAQQLPKQAVPYLLRASETATKHQLPADEVNSLLWKSLQQLSQVELESLNYGTQIQMGWVSLAGYAQRFKTDESSFNNALLTWQRRYPRHPAKFVLPSDIASTVDVTPYTGDRIAVILPTSRSNNQRISDAIKNGIMAAVGFSSQKQVVFIDSDLSADEIATELNELQPDFVLGPLLKANIDKLQAANVLAPYPTLFLNALQQAPNSPEHYSFALKPEHEVTQVVYHFISQGYKKPLVLASGNKAGKRLAEHFVKQWQLYSEVEPAMGFFATRKEMQKTVEQMLEVDLSKERIDQIERLFTQSVESETRSRRDIDAIYIIGDGIETRLLKPSFDVNISTFAKRIPIYAGSRSHDVAVDKSDKKDLSGLYFSEMPWLLPFTSNSVRTEYDGIWQDKSDLEQQLYAMGYDAVKLIPALRQLQTFPDETIQGLTGQLSLNDLGEVERILTWAQYQDNRIKAVDLNTQKPTPLFIQAHQQLDVTDTQTSPVSSIQE